LISSTGGRNALGGAYNSESLSAYSGQIHNSPQFFTHDGPVKTYAQGGIFGEAGPEAIMPLKRGPGGQLGVEAFGGASLELLIKSDPPELANAMMRASDGVKEYSRAVEVASDLTVSMTQALGMALATGEGYWEAFGKAGLNAVAGMIEAFGQQLALQGAAALIPGIGFNPLAAAGYVSLATGAYATAGLVRAIKMAEGGSGTVSGPTLFLAGEAGKEDFAFSPHRKGGLGGGVTIIQNISGAVWQTQQLESLALGAVVKAQRGF
jgi:hypothetical protein